MPAPAKTPSRTRKWVKWLTWESLVSVEQRVAILFACLAGGAALAAARGRDIEDGAFPYGLPAALILIAALDAYYHLRYRPKASSRRKNGSK